MADEMIIADSDGLPLSSKKKYSKNDLERFYRINKTIHEMLHDRGYLIFTEDLQQTFKNFKQNFTSIETHHIHATHSTDPKKSILVIFDHFPGNKKMILTDRSLGEMSRRHNDIYENCKHKIVVSNRQIGPKAKKMCGPHHSFTAYWYFYFFAKGTKQDGFLDRLNKFVTLIIIVIIVQGIF